MAKKDSNIHYVCSECGHIEAKWAGRCPDCGSWNTFVEEIVAPPLPSGAKSIMADGVVRLSDITYDESSRVSSGIEELDRVLGGGVMRPSSVLVGGEPGIGKSTIMLQMVSRLSSSGLVLYVSGEESPSQVKMRAERLGLDTERISIFCDTRLEALAAVIEELKPAFIVVDSLQTLYAASQGTVSGTVAQMKLCCTELTLVSKRIGSSIFFIGHVTKDGSIAGPKTVEHMVDTVLYFEAVETGMRLLRASKNRFGSVDEIGIFMMDGKGLHGVSDPSSFFLSSRRAESFPSGIVFTPVIEGSRTFVVEIQALVVPARTGLQRIYSDRVDSSRVMRVAAILERHAGLNLADQDIYLNVAGGMRLTEGSIDLAVALALYSARMNRALSSSLASFGELSLAGEVRPVSFRDKRLRALKEMGFERVLTNSDSSDRDIKIERSNDIKSAVIAAFSVN